MKEYYQISRCRDKDRLFRELTDKQLNILESVLDAYVSSKIDFVDPETNSVNPAYDGVYELVINDCNYQGNGCELFIMKWAEDRESTDNLIDYLEEFR